MSGSISPAKRRAAFCLMHRFEENHLAAQRLTLLSAIIVSFLSASISAADPHCFGSVHAQPAARFALSMLAPGCWLTGRSQACSWSIPRANIAELSLTANRNRSQNQA
jgi:hypothetical protein